MHRFRYQNYRHYSSCLANITDLTLRVTPSTSKKKLCDCYYRNINASVLFNGFLSRSSSSSSTFKLNSDLGYMISRTRTDNNSNVISKVNRSYSTAPLFSIRQQEQMKLQSQSQQPQKIQTENFHSNSLSVWAELGIREQQDYQQIYNNNQNQNRLHFPRRSEQVVRRDLKTVVQEAKLFLELINSSPAPSTSISTNSVSLNDIFVNQADVIRSNMAKLIGSKHPILCLARDFYRENSGVGITGLNLDLNGDPEKSESMEKKNNQAYHSSFENTMKSIGSSPCESDTSVHERVNPGIPRAHHGSENLSSSLSSLSTQLRAIIVLLISKSIDSTNSTNHHVHHPSDMGNFESDSGTSNPGIPYTNPGSRPSHTNFNLEDTSHNGRLQGNPNRNQTVEAKEMKLGEITEIIYAAYMLHQTVVELPRTRIISEINPAEYEEQLTTSEVQGNNGDCGKPELAKNNYSDNDNHNKNSAQSPVSLSSEETSEDEDARLSLLHDGNNLAVLMGDLLLAKSSRGLASLRNSEVTVLMSDSIADFAQSQFITLFEPVSGAGAKSNLAKLNNNDGTIVKMKNQNSDPNLKKDNCGSGRGGEGVGLDYGERKTEKKGEIINRDFWFRRNGFGLGSLLGHAAYSALLLRGEDVALRNLAYRLGETIGLALQAAKEISSFQTEAPPNGWTLDPCALPVITGLELGVISKESLHRFVKSSGPERLVHEMQILRLIQSSQNGLALKSAVDIFVKLEESAVRILSQLSPIPRRPQYHHPSSNLSTSRSHLALDLDSSSLAGSLVRNQHGNQSGIASRILIDLIQSFKPIL